MKYRTEGWSCSVSKMMLTEILDASVTFVNQPFATPLVLSSGPIDRATQATAEATVRVGGKEATGHSSISLGHLWAWPDPGFSHEEKDAILRELCSDIAGDLRALCGAKPAHPLELGLLLSFQDLTNPGLALIHAALFAAHMPTINGIELNSPQFTPAANKDWLPRFSGLFDPTAGAHRIPERIPSGLGSTL